MMETPRAPVDKIELWYQPDNFDGSVNDGDLERMLRMIQRGEKSVVFSCIAELLPVCLAIIEGQLSHKDVFVLYNDCLYGFEPWGAPEFPLPDITLDWSLKVNKARAHMAGWDELRGTFGPPPRPVTDDMEALGAILATHSPLSRVYQQQKHAAETESCEGPVVVVDGVLRCENPQCSWESDLLGLSEVPNG